MLLYNAVLRRSLWLSHLFVCAVMTKCLLQSGWTQTHPPTHTPYSKPPKWPICEHVWPATVDQCKFVRQWSMQESPVRAEATRYPHPLHGVCVCVCRGKDVTGRKRHSECTEVRKWGRGELTVSEAHLTVWLNVICWIAQAPPSLKFWKKKFYSSRHIFIPPLLSHFTRTADALIVLALQGSLFACSW